MILGIPLIVGLIVAASGFGLAEVLEFSADLFIATQEPTICMYIGGLTVGLAVWFYNHKKYTNVIPTRFNRQRREVCFMPTGAETPVFVPWESLSAWVVQARGATQYGVRRQYGMGM
ncbi:hypothetical protein [Pseudomonas frederiksbergensis]|uniref:hypothetical protein n=1 Tax=Pseudomonas frederiksbergensis TaxID=104087 RepID=UPI003D225ACE